MPEVHRLRLVPTDPGGPEADGLEVGEGRVCLVRRRPWPRRGPCAPLGHVRDARSGTPADLAEVGRLSPGAQFALQRAQAERPGAMLLPVRLDDGVRDACWLPPGDPGTVAAATSERVRAADVRLRGPSGASGGRLVIGLRDRSGRILAIVHPTPASGAAARRAADARAGSVLVRGGGRASRNAIVEAIRTAGS